MRRLGPPAAIALLAALDALLSSASADCTCRAQGRDLQLGERACLTTPAGARFATCGMVLNNSSWEFSDAPCTVSAVPPPDQPRRVQAREGTARRTTSITDSQWLRVAQ